MGAKSVFFDNLIELVKERPVLYDPGKTNKDHLKYLQDQAWLEISTNLRVPVDMCKSRWEFLEEKYKQIHKQCLAPTVNRQRYRSTWQYYKPLHFLWDRSLRTVVNKETKDQEIKDQKPDPDNSELEPTETMMIMESLDESLSQNETIKLPNTLKFEDEPMIDIKLSDESPAKILRTRRARIIQKKADPPKKKSSPLQKKPIAKLPTSDKTELFFMLLECEINAAKLPRLKQMKLEAELLNFVVSNIEEMKNEQ